VTNYESFANQGRLLALKMVHQAKASHIGSAFSMMDILAVLYSPEGRLRIRPEQPEWQDRDRFLLSKGHACTGLYAALAIRGFIEKSELDLYAQDGQRLMSHASHKVPGIEISTGSLGHGLPMGTGMALGCRLSGSSWRTVVLVSDGELDEGSNWEAILFAGHHRLGKLLLIVDYNKIQSLGRVESIMALEPLTDKFKAFGWDTIEVDGHDHSSLHEALDLDRLVDGSRPTVILAHTVKGKGVSFMENTVHWHYKSPDKAQFEAAASELENSRT